MADGPSELALEDLEFSQLVRRGDHVLWTQGAGEPLPLIARLLDQRHQVGPFSVLLGASYVDLVRPEHADCITFTALGAVGTTRAMVAAGVADVLPCHLSEVSALLATGDLPSDVVIVQLAQDPVSGEFSFSSVNGYVGTAIQNARLVIAEVNDRAPWTPSRHPCNPADIDLVVRTSRDLVETPAEMPSPIDRTIAGHVVDLVPDGATIQLGIGGVPRAVTALLTRCRHLSMHTGVVGDAVVDLIESGALTNAGKPFDRGLTVTGGLVGTKRLFDFAHHNLQMTVEPASYTHAPGVLCRLPNLIAINSALEVDLTGQVGSEVAGSRYVGTVGGQVDFVRGALASEGGRSIIALASRTSAGSPRIVPVVRSGAVTVPRADADAVVTEWGTAHLRGRSITERVRAMIAVAHPDDRDELERQVASHVAGFFPQRAANT